MALSFISKLPKGEQQELLDDLNYLNVGGDQIVLQASFDSIQDCH